jgi:hypothetical protein
MMPIDARIIRIDGIEGQLYLWAIVETDYPAQNRTFHLFKTGSKMPDDIEKYVYLGCGAIYIQMELMMYVFEKFPE